MGKVVGVAFGLALVVFGCNSKEWLGSFASWRGVGRSVQQETTLGTDETERGALGLGHLEACLVDRTGMASIFGGIYTEEEVLL